MAKKKEEKIENQADFDKTDVSNTKANSFYDINFNEVDRDLLPEQKKEWTDIYASFRSKAPLQGRVIGVEYHKIPIRNFETGKTEIQEIQCLIVMDVIVKVIIPTTEIWYVENQYPSFAVSNMIGAVIEYVIINVDRDGECAIASRKMALGHRRNRFLRNPKNTAGEIVDCSMLVVGPSRVIVECGGFDVELGPRDISYTAMSDLRKEYRSGEVVKAKIKAIDVENAKLGISIKEVNPNPFDNAERRHPVGSLRGATISGTYGGGVFCRLKDNTNIMCLYTPQMFSEEFYKDDEVLIKITRYDYDHKMIYGKIMSRW